MPELPEPLRQAIERGELTRDQLLQLIELEAQSIGLSREEALEHAKQGTLPKNYIGQDLSLLIELLLLSEPQAA